MPAATRSVDADCVGKILELFRSTTSSEKQLTDSLERLAACPIVEDAKEWVGIVRDDNLPPLNRQLAFVVFGKRFLKARSDLGVVARQYGILGWMTGETILDWTLSDSTPLDDLRQGDRGIYVFVAPRAIQTPRNDIWICFALPHHISEREILTRIGSADDGPLQLLATSVHGPFDR
jgi:hypothetical protein